MKISEYIVSYAKSLGVKHFFGLQGSGTAVQIFDALAAEEGIDYVCTLHEQAAGMAADAYANITENIGFCVTDSGPAASNLYTAIAGSFYNSVPVVYLIGQPQSGQLRRDTSLRHYAFHENDVEIFRPVTKYLTQLLDPQNARYELEKAVYMAKEGRPGPVLIAIPDDITWLDIDPQAQKGFVPEEKEPWNPGSQLEEIIKLMGKAQRPVLLVGNGIRCAHAKDVLLNFLDRTGWPVAMSWGVRDLLPAEDKRNVTSFGMMGTRAGNFAVQNADLILAVGSRLDSSEIGGNPKTFARGAKVISVDVDTAELKKYAEYGIPCDMAVRADAREFFTALNSCLTEKISLPGCGAWLDQIAKWKSDYSMFREENYEKGTVNPYHFVEVLGNIMGSGEVVATDVSTSRSYIFQAFAVKPGQRLLAWHNFSCLGYGLPAAIGAAFARPESRIVAVMGDGALQFNIQELATVAFNRLNLKIIVFNNGGFGSIMRAQNRYLGGRHYGADRENGLPLPDSAKIAQAYGLPVFHIYQNEEIPAVLQEVLSQDGPAYCEVHLPIEYWPTPCRAGADPIEDMTPKLPEEEFHRQMIVEPLR